MKVKSIVISSLLVVLTSAPALAVEPSNKTWYCYFWASESIDRLNNIPNPTEEQLNEYSYFDDLQFYTNNTLQKLSDPKKVAQQKYKWYKKQTITVSPEYCQDQFGVD